MAAGIGSMNFWYERYSLTPGISTTQPGVTTSSWVDPGEGWSRYRYKDFNGDYERYTETPGVPAPPPAPYQRHVAVYDADGNVIANNPVTPATYQRYDNQDPPQPVPNPIPTDIPNS